MADTNDTNDIVSEDNFIGTDEDGNSYYADDDGNVAMVDSDGTVTTESKDEQPSGNADNYEGVEETLNTDTSREYTFDDNGNLVDSDTGEQVDTSHWGDVIGEASVAAGGKKTPVAGYTYAGTDKKGNPFYLNPNRRPFTKEMLDEQLHNIYGGDKDAKAAANIAATFGPAALNNNVLDYYSKDPNAEEIMSKAAAGNGAAQALIAAMTGTTPTNITDGRVYDMLADLSERLEKGEDLKTAYFAAGDKAGLTNNKVMNATLRDSILQTLTMVAGPLLGAAARAANAGKIGRLLRTSGILNRVAERFPPAFPEKYANRILRKSFEAIKLMEKADKMSTAINIASLAGQLGVSVAEAKEIADAYKGTKASENRSPYTNPNGKALELQSAPKPAPKSTAEDKISAATAKAETKASVDRAPEPKVEIETERNPTTEALAKAAFEEKPVDLNIGLPGVDWLEVERGREKEDPNAGRDRGFEDEDSGSDDSGSDTLETTTQDAPTGGVGTDTFANPNNDNERKSWGLSEEDPNRANYDIDKWNRGMERVSTDIVSDAKCKDFITKTYSKDPVLIKMVKIMKTKS